MNSTQNGNNKQSNNNYDMSRVQNKRMAQNGQHNPYADSYIQNNSEVRRMQERHRAETEGYSRPRKKKKSVNRGLLLFIALITAVLVFSIVKIAKNNPKAPVDDTPTPPPIDTPVDDTADESVPEAGVDKGEEEPVYSYQTVTVSNETVDDGLLVLVNATHPYADADKVSVLNLYNNRSTDFKVAGTDICLTKVAFDALEDMVTELENETGCDDLIVNSGYRTVAEQEDIYDYYLDLKGKEYVASYVANPSCSEHHTGLACDLSFFLDEGYSESIGLHAHGSFVSTRCTDYGFVVRYPADKVQYTGIAYEAWHFRYVGPVHAKIMSAKNYCLEEYINALKDTSESGGMFSLSEDGTVSMVNSDSLPSSGCLVYARFASDGDTTDIPVLSGGSSTYEISGTNDGCFIVTIHLD